jgi:bifunctional ADP-heptose synthase (sugar kinase/adenylyltransferase)
MDDHPKILSIDKAAAQFDAVRQMGRRLVQYEENINHFQLGQISALEKARNLGDLLVLTLTTECKNGNARRALSSREQLLVAFLATLPYVDYLMIGSETQPVEMIETVRPRIYCRSATTYNGSSADTVLSATVLEALERVGGVPHLIAEKPSTASEALGELFLTYSPEVKNFCRLVGRQFSPDQFQRITDEFSKLKVLIVGDIIFDRYCSVEVQGLTSKNRILSARLLSEDTQAGGALAVFRHIRQFTQNVKLISLAGTEPWVNETLASFILPSEREIVQVPEFTTVVKQRFVEPRMEGKELSKLFAVNMIDKHHPDETLQRAVLDRIAGHIDGYDVVLVMDFGHGLMEDPIRDYVQEKARFLALNCQTNSNNHGFNIINRQYARADSFSLDQTEITLAVGRRRLDFHHELQRLGQAMGSSYAWLTRGGTETLGFAPGMELCCCAPFERNVVDTVGAGDAFCAITSLAAAAKLPLPIATFMGQLAGAQAVRVVGNAEPVRKPAFVESGRAMLSL